MIQKIAWMIPLFPLLGFIINSFGRKIISRNMSGIIASLMVFIPLIFAFDLFFSVTDKVTVHLFNWISAGVINIPFEFLIDPLSITMMLVVTGVGFLIHVYSIGYMGHDEHANTFFAYLNLFIFFMLLLVMGANYLILFIGWEGVGLCSYLLIGFWYKNTEYNNAARKAFVMNRIGDLGFLLGIILMLFAFGSVNFKDVFPAAGSVQSGNVTVTIITLLLMIGALGKSAQIPLYTWLPDAMAGPTPVSALIHAATMVTAGIYMIARSSILYSLAPITSGVIVVIGLATAVFAASIGLLQNDIKKVLAYSTVSQLGYMFLALGLGAYSSAMFHVTTHAFFKALLFLGAGSVMHALNNGQDIRGMGGLRKKLPITFITFLIATLAISGIPPFSGFFSKDEILAKAFASNPSLWVVGMIGALFTCFYMFRLFYLVFYGKFRGTSEQEAHVHESPLVMTIPLIVLAVLAFLGGFLNFPAIFGGKESFAEYLKPSLAGQYYGKELIPHQTELLLMASSVIILLAVIFIAWQVFVKRGTVPADETTERKGLVKLVYNKYFIDELYNSIFVKPYNFLSEKVFSWIDRVVIDGIVNSFGEISIICGRSVRKLQNGNTSFYLFVMAWAIVAMFIYLMLV
ncbi:MAG: NADH-quinone oxidoreductase subunit L [Bacteroidota bacterium]|nr:NADH-quinone oxidoreductase subunit L [Bacteroidota bacterium]